jgi:CheY-like chemotaxis protein
MEKDAPILLVDDSMAMRQTIKKVLTDLEYTNIHLANNGVEALGKIKDSLASGAPYRMIFLDWNMPAMDGYSLLQLCRGELGLTNAAIIMLTAVSDQKSIVKAMNAGANSYITKPVSPETIATKIEQVSAWIDNQRKNV